ncbi:MAG: pleD [Bacillales bacterium]|jgi:diguanylate cyclase (GGDEF)-like protein|nr:pleD [Bacillales bacterium]
MADYHDFIPIEILVVEENQKDRETISSLLTSLKLDFITETSVELGLIRLNTYNPHILICDSFDYDSTNFIDCVRKVNKEVKIIIISNQIDNSSCINAFDNSVYKILSKPIVEEDFSKMLFECCELIKVQQQLKKQRHFARVLMDYQEDLIFIARGNKIIDCNKSFLNYFNYPSLNEYLENHCSCFANLFNSNSCLTHKFACESNKLHIDDINETTIRIHVPDTNGENRTFFVRAIDIDPLKNEILVVFTDITFLEEENKKIEILANTDPLTKIYNRLKFNVIASEEISRVKSNMGNLSVVLFDIDHFKRVNDNYGHIVGDEVLVKLASVLKDMLRITDTLARWGGEEFIILLTDTNEYDSLVFCELIRKKIEETIFNNAGNITCSFGVSSFKENKTLENLISEADSALYIAKNSGRNRVELYTNLTVNFN